MKWNAVYSVLAWQKQLFFLFVFCLGGGKGVGLSLFSNCFKHSRLGFVMKIEVEYCSW